jgi:hypothetical protein
VIAADTQKGKYVSFFSYNLGKKGMQMGGFGSGRQAEVYSGTVEESLSLDVNRFVREGIIRQECKTIGTISWSQFAGMTSSIGYEAYCDKDSGNIRLFYTLSHLVLGDKDFSYYVELTKNPISAESDGG